MIKFFRTIRGKQVQENRAFKYMLYALGEIALVVIGILIALKINTYNEQQKALAKEQQILEQLKTEYETNLAQLNQKVFMRNEAIEGSHFLLEQIDQSTAIDETNVLKALGTISRDPTFDPIKNDIIGTDKIQLIRNENLVRALSNWSSDVYQVQEIELQFQKFRAEIIFPCYIRLGIARDIHNELWKDGYTPVEALDQTYNYKFKINRSQKNISLTKALQDLEIEGIVSQTITFHQVANIQSESLKDRINNIIKLINQELN